MKQYVPALDSREEFLRFLDSLENETRDEHDERVREWQKNANWAGGRKIWPAPPAPGPMFLANLILPELERKAALLTESKPKIQVAPRRNGLTVSSQVLTDTIAALWDEQNLTDALSDLAKFLGRCGCGFIKATWDAAANYGLGDIVIAIPDPRCIQIDPAIRRPKDLDDAQYIIEHSLRPLTELQARYPEHADEIKADASAKADASDKGLMGRIGSRFKSIIKGAQSGKTGGDTGAIPRCMAKEYYFVDPASDGDGGLKYPNGRCIIRVGDVIVNELKGKPLSTGNPYFDGRWPYVMMDIHGDMDAPFGTSDVSLLRRIQDAFNRIGHHMMRALVQGSRGWLITDNNALSATQVSDLRDLDYVVVEKMTGRTVERTPPLVPTAQYMDFMRFMQGFGDYITGQNDNPVQGKGRVELRSADQLEGLQQQGQTVVRQEARNLEAMLDRLGQKLISRIFQFYTGDRLLNFVNQDKMQQYQFESKKLRDEIVQMANSEIAREEAAWTAEHPDEPFPMTTEEKADKLLEKIKGAWREYRFRCVPLSSLASTKIARTQLLRALAQEALYPPSKLMEELGFENGSDLTQQAMQEIMARQAMGIGVQPPKGKGKK